MGEKAEPKISLPEAVFIGIFLGILDIIDLIPAAGDITDVFAAPLVFYYFMKHINGIAYIGSLILDMIPFTQEFPTRSVVWWGTVIIDHFAPKKLSQAVEKIGETGEGNLEEGGVTGEAEETATKDLTKGGENEASNPKEEGSAGNQSETDVQEKNPEENGTDTNLDEDGGEEGENENDDIMLGSEISPDKEAEQTDFDLPEENLYNGKKHK